MGLFSSMHCLGMCGSIIGTLTLSLRQEIRQHKSQLTLFVFSYNLGRILSYAFGGLIAGLVGKVFLLPFEEHGHRILQIISALFMAGAGLYVAGWFPGFAYIERLGARFWRIIEPFGQRLIPVSTLPHALFFGIIWGWLPCGLVYMALALATTTGDPLGSALTMTAFGIGTLPAVVGVGIMTNLLTTFSTIRKFKIFAGLFLLAIAFFAAFPDLNPLRFHSMQPE
ncbi:MAG: sulfite exporter TauE/SafE family protein [Gammaproteobacteria bacterium]|nr:sulfite exporter TauE/SafE family protein [Gammaproteobacteria bacterium]